MAVELSEVAEFPEIPEFSEVAEVAEVSKVAEFSEFSDCKDSTRRAKSQVYLSFSQRAAEPSKKTSDYPLIPCAQANKPLPLHSLNNKHQ